MQKEFLKSFIKELVSAHIHAIQSQNDANGIYEKPRKVARRAERIVRKKLKKLDSSVNSSKT